MMRDPMRDRRYALYVLVLLSLINFLNYADRQIMFALYPHVQDELGFSDLQLGMLGAAFLLVHSLSSLPGGWLADHWFKRKVIAVGVALWSVATLLGAVARGFADLFFYRSLVGVGEALYHPAANAMLSDHFPRSERGRAMGVFSVGMVLGGGGGIILGTAIGDYFGWRYAFLVAGLPGFLLALLAWRLREGRPSAAAPLPAPEMDAVTAPNDSPPAPHAWSRLWRTPTVLLNLAGGICVTFCIGGIIAWTASFLDRYFVQPQAGAAHVVVAGASAAAPAPFGMAAAAAITASAAARTLSVMRDTAVPRAARQDGELARVSASFGIVALSAGVLGSFFGGWLADRLMRRRRSGRLLVSAGGFLLGVPFVLGGLYATTVTQFLVCLFPGMFFFSCYMGPSIAILHDVTPYRFRGSVAAGYIFMVHLLGDAISPPIIGLLSQISELRHALLLPIAMAILGSVFFLLATRTVERDMLAAEREGAADTVD
jgi:MFS family permease